MTRCSATTMSRSIYDELTDGRRAVRVSELVYAGLRSVTPACVPTRAEIDDERELAQKDKRGLEIGQGVFVAHVLADRRRASTCCTRCRSRAQALASSASCNARARRPRSRCGSTATATSGSVTIQNHAFLNSEDDVSTAALEIAVDLVLLDDAIQVGVLRGGAGHASEVRRPAHLRLGHQPHAPLLRQDLARRVHDRARARRGEQDVPRPRPRPIDARRSRTGGRSRGSPPSRRSPSAAPASGCW